MSIYYHTEEDQIYLDRDEEEVVIYVTSDDWGSVYKTLTFNQIKKIYKSIIDS